MDALQENALVLQRMASKGVDLVSARLIEFEHVFANQVSAQNFMTAATNAFPKMLARAPFHIGNRKWNVLCQKRMLPTNSGITEAEKTGQTR